MIVVVQGSCITMFDETQGHSLFDDETYMSNSILSSFPVKSYFAIGCLDVPGRFNIVFVDKFAKKSMIRQMICSCGLKREPFVTSSTMPSQVYTVKRPENTCIVVHSQA